MNNTKCLCIVRKRIAVRRVLKDVLRDVLLAACLAMPYSIHAEEILLAVASNFAAPMGEIAERFEAQSGHEVNLAFGSSGRFYAQISNGAPFQLFFSADQEKPQALIAAGLAQADTLTTYAEGTLVLWSASLNVTGPEFLSSQSFTRLALANPALAPYGKAAVETLTALEMRAATEAKWVQGENIAQAFQFVESGNAELGFVARSQVAAKPGAQSDDIEITGSGWIVPADLHTPIYQDAILLTRARDCTACLEFLGFMQTAEVRTLIARYGYRTSGSIPDSTSE